MTPTTVPTPWFQFSQGLLERAWSHWRSMVVLTLSCGVASGGTSFILPSYYRSSTAFQAEGNQPSPLSGALAGLASQIGNVQLSSQTSSQFFADLLITDAVLGRVARDSFEWQGAFTSLPAIYGLADEGVRQREFDTVKKLRSAIAVDVNLRTGVVRFSIEARTANLAKVLAESTLAALNAANIDLRQTRAAAERGFTSDRAAHALDELHAAERSLADFYEHNRAISSSPTLQLQEGQLKRQVDMAQQVYVQLRLQAEQAAVQEVRNTPAISVVDPPLVPVRRSSPNRRLAVVFGLVFGAAIALTRQALQMLSHSAAPDSLPARIHRIEESQHSV